MIPVGCGGTVKAWSCRLVTNTKYFSMSTELMDGTVECSVCNLLMNNSEGDLRNSEKAGKSLGGG